MTPDDVLVNYHRWLLKMASSLMPWGNEQDKQDLAQEGHIAMWKALKTHDPDKGSLPSWLTTTARLRMTDVIRRGTLTGMPEHRGNKRVEAMPVDASEDECMVSLCDGKEWVESIIMAYHSGQVSNALNRLTKIQRDYVIRRFWRCQPDSTLELVAGKRSRDMWREIQPQLAQALSHLASTV